MTPPPGCEEYGEGVVYECLRQIYGVPSSACALWAMLSKWFGEHGFETVGLEDSVWCRPAGGQYTAKIIVSAHINDQLIACCDLKARVMQQFKNDFLKRFMGTEERSITSDVR